MICTTIQKQKTSPTHGSARALLVKKLFPVPADLSAKLLAGYTELNKAMTDDPGALSHPKTSLIWRAGLTRARYPSRRSTRTLPKVWAVLIADHCPPPIPCDNTSTYWTHFVNTSSGWKPVLMMVDMQQRSIIEILLTVSAT